MNMSDFNGSLSNPFDYVRHDRPLRILSIDGGGVVHGLSALVVLSRIMDRQATALSLGNSGNISRPCEHFDLILGSGTGGIVALLLGPLRLSVPEAIKAYVDLLQSTFGRRLAINSSKGRELWAWATSLAISRNNRDTARAERFQRAFQNLLRRLGIDPEQGLRSSASTDLDDEEAPICRTAVTASSSSAPENLLRSYDSNSAGGGNISPTPPIRDVRIWEAALATVTTTTPGQLPNASQFDASTRNPTRLALAEVERLWPGRPLGLIVSLGAREATTTRRMRSSSNASARTMAAADGIHEQVSRESGESYFRFDVGGLERVESWVEGDRVRIITAVESWMSSRAVALRMEKCVDEMAALAQWVPPIPPTPRLRGRTLDSTTSSVVPLPPEEMEGAFTTNAPYGSYNLEFLTGALAMANLNTIPDGFPHPSDLDDMESRDTVPPTPPPRYRPSPSGASSPRSSIQHPRRSSDLPSPYMSTLGGTAESAHFDSPGTVYLNPPNLQENPVDFTPFVTDTSSPSNHRSASISSGGSSST